MNYVKMSVACCICTAFCATTVPMIR